MTTLYQSDHHDSVRLTVWRDDEADGTIMIGAEDSHTGHYLPLTRKMRDELLALLQSLALPQ